MNEATSRGSWRRGIGIRVALAALGTASLAVLIVAVGVLVVGGDTFARLMMEHGSTAEEAHAMFDSSVTLVLGTAVVIAILAAAGLAALVGRRLARPLGEIGAAAGRVAAGDYGARVPRDGPDEIASLADSFNQMAASLEEQERVRREFIANASHELRTPLTNLQGYLEALRDGVVPADAAAYASLLEEVERLTRLAASLDQLTAAGSGAHSDRVAEVDLVEAIRNAVDLVTPSLDRSDITVGLELPDRLTVHVDPDGLSQVLGNLLQNAVRYTRAGGMVTIRAERRDGDGLVSVANTGDTIPAADLPHVFDRFYRVEKSRDRDRGGAGIGLAIVKQQVEATGGRVGVDSSAGLTRFWFRLPG